MVSNATVSQCIEGVDFPATAADIVGIIRGKVERGQLPEEFVAPVRELFEALPQNATLMNMAHLWTEVGAVQKALRETGGAKPVRAENVLSAEREDAPLGIGEVKADYDMAERVRQYHDQHRNE